MDRKLFEDKVEKFCQDELKISPLRGNQNFKISKEILAKLFRFGYFKGLVTKELNGEEWDELKIGIFNEILAKYSPQLRTFLTVQGMVIYSVARWGNKNLKENLLPLLLDGRYICSFALSEQGAGSDISSLTCKGIESENNILVSGEKTWISYGEVADGFLTFIKVNDRYCSIIIDNNPESILVTQIDEITSYESTFMANLKFTDCSVPQNRILGNIGLGLNLIAPYALDYGRYSVAWGSLGLAERIFNLTIERLQTREQFGNKLSDIDLIKSDIANMIVSLMNMRSRCEAAASSRKSKSSNTVMEDWCAKYYCSKECHKIANKALQLGGAWGMLNNELNNLCREAAALEIIEGTSQICELEIANQYFMDLL